MSFPIIIPACTLSPTCSSDIGTDLPFSRDTVDIEGKHLSELLCGKSVNSLNCLSWCFVALCIKYMLKIVDIKLFNKSINTSCYFYIQYRRDLSLWD